MSASGGLRAVRGLRPQFRATSGLTVQQQLELAAKAADLGDDLLQKVEAVKVSSKKLRTEGAKKKHKFDWVQELQRLSAEEAMIEKDLIQFASQVDACGDSGDRLLSMAEVKLSHKAQLAMFKAQLGAIKLLMSFHTGKPEASDGKLAEGDEAAFQRRTALLRAGGILEELSAFMSRIHEQLNAEEAELSRQVHVCKEAVLDSVRNEGTSGVEGDLSDGALLALIDAHGGRECPDAELRIEVFEKLCVHRNMYLQDVEGERTSWDDTCEAFGVAPEDKQGGWQERDHLIYTKIWKEVSSKRAGVDRGKLLTRLALELPGKSPQELEAHDAWFRARRQHATRLKDLEERWIRQRDDDVEAAEKTFARIRSEADAAAAEAAAAMEAQRSAENARARLAALRSEKMAALEEAAARSALTKAMADQIEALREERQRAVAAAKKTKLESWKLRALEDQHRAEVAEDIVSLEAQRVREEERGYLEERVAFREGLLEEKAELARLAKEQAEREEDERLARLEEVARSVPYREALDAIAPDPERTRAHTITSQLAAQLGISHAEFIACGGDIRQLVGTGDKSDLVQHRLAERGFFMTEGYSNKQIFDNLQFKVGMALREAGIHNSDYARGVMLSMAREGPALKATHNFA